MRVFVEVPSMPGSPAASNSSKAQKRKSLLSLAAPGPVAQGEQDEAGEDLPKAPAKKQKRYATVLAPMEPPYIISNNPW